MIVAPAPQDGVELLDHLRQRPAVPSSDDASHLLLDPLCRCRGGPDTRAVLELRLGLAHPAQPNVDAQEVESVLGVDDAGLLRMQLQAETAQHSAYLGEYPLAVGSGVKQDDEVVTVAHQGSG